MFENFELQLKNWNRRTSDRQKLQQVYAVLLVIVVFLAGLVTLFSGDPSNSLQAIAAVLAITFVTNLVAWGLLNSLILDKIKSASPRPRQTTDRK